ncbi:MAG: hypothetical protein KDA84_18680 [Planctomycetaceae bacterium]|nr:hypothetical protein [Planctomycetaceae bacterium]
MLMRVLAITSLGSCLVGGIEAPGKERFVAVFPQQTTKNLLVVNDEMHVKEYDLKTRRVLKYFENPQRVPGRLLAGGFQPIETFKVQRSFDERWLAVAYEPENGESDAALQIIIWDCQTGRIKYRSEIPQDSAFGHNFPQQLDFVLTDEWRLLYLKMFDKLLVWDIRKSAYIRKHHIGDSTSYDFDQRKSRIAWMQHSKMILRDSRSDEFLQEISLDGYIAEKPLFMKDGRILFAAYADKSEDTRITSPYPLLVCYDTVSRRIKWRQAFDTKPIPWHITSDNSQVLVEVTGEFTDGDFKAPFIDDNRVVKQTVNGKQGLFPIYGACTLNLDDGTNRVYHYKGILFSRWMDAQYSPNGKQLAYISSTGLGHETNYASIIRLSDGRQIANINLLKKDVDKLLVLDDDQGLLLWSKFGRWILHWNPSTNQLSQGYPESVIPANAEKP